MTALDWVVVVGGIAVITWINWYFFLAEGGGRQGAEAGAAAQDGARQPPQLTLDTKGPDDDRGG